MLRPTEVNPELGDARMRPLGTALNVARRSGFTAATVDHLCREAQMTKGAYFHHFCTKVALGVAAAEHWTATTAMLFARAPYHDHDNPLDCVPAYTDLRRSLVGNDIVEFPCRASTMAHETFALHPAIRDACADRMPGGEPDTGLSVCFQAGNANPECIPAASILSEHGSLSVDDTDTSGSPPPKRLSQDNAWMCQRLPTSKGPPGEI